ncbi:MAG TPA: alginate lyase family protein, partial [Bacteroidales bacterium]|nr:alginate lyase family protein [Bacteroidales bacterium]
MLHFFAFALILMLTGCIQKSKHITDDALIETVLDQERERLLSMADEYMDEKPHSVTDWICERSAGSPNDFYSEGDYWWPDPDNPGGPYIRKDGYSNPDMFTKHREAMIRMSKITGVMASVYILTGEDKYVEKAMDHLRVWFIDQSTRMNPNMLYSQAIMGRHTGRGIGIIDAIHLVEPALAIKSMENSDVISNEELNAMKSWFSEFLNWIYTHDYGKDEMVHPNNHGTCWALQAAAYAYLTDNDEMLSFAAKRYKAHLLPDQMAEDGSFPLELDRTKPYGYSIFNLDAMSSLVQVLSLSGNNLFSYETDDNRSLKTGVEFLFPYIRNKENWPYGEDVLYFDDFPVRQAFLLFGGLEYDKPEYIDQWVELESDPDNSEVVRNTIVKNPLIWLDINQPVGRDNPERVVYHQGATNIIDVPDSLWHNEGTISFEFKLSEASRASRTDIIDCPVLYMMLRGKFMWPEFSEVPTPEGARAERIQFAYLNNEQWYHLTVCWDGPGSKMRLYLNGEPQQRANMRRWTESNFSGSLLVGNEDVETRNIAMYDGFAEEELVKQITSNLDLVPLSGEGRKVYDGPMQTDKYEKQLVYETDFSGEPKIVQEEDLFVNGERQKLPEGTDWVIEGRATAKIVDGKMVVTNSREGDDPGDNHAVLWNTEVFPENFLV